MKCSVLVNAALRPDYLDLCILSYYTQSCRDFEMVVAEDGTDPAMKAVVEKHLAAAPFPIRHVNQPREGHRRALILNKGIAACRSDYVIFTDCDSLAPAHMVATHLKRRKPGRMLIGGRIMLTEEQTTPLNQELVERGEFGHLPTKAQVRQVRIQQWKNIFQILTRRKRRPHNYGLNMSLWMDDLVKVNGYDNNFLGWGNADGDLRERLKAVGVYPLSVFSEIFILHLWHPSLQRGERNREYARREVVPPVAENGLVQARADFNS